MKILVITNLYPPLIRGEYELGCRDVVESLKSRNHHVVVLTSMYGVDRPHCDNDISRNLEHFWVNYPQSDSQLSYLQTVRSKWISIRNYMIVAKTIDLLKPDIVYIWGLKRIGSLNVLMAVENRKIPGIIHLMDDSLHETRLQNLRKNPLPVKLLKTLLQKRIDRILFGIPLILMSKTLHDDYVHCGFPEDHMHMVLPALPLQPVKPVSRRKHDRLFRLLYVGRLDDEYGVHTALEALIRLHKYSDSPIFTLDLIGGGSPQCIRSLHQLAATNLVASYLRFHGQIPREEIFKIMPEYDSLIFPPLRRDPFGFAVLEALMAGLPVIASEIGGPMEIMREGKTGLFFKPGNAADLAEKISMLQKNPELWQNIRSNSYTHACTTFKFNEYVDKIEEILNRMVEQ